MSASTISDSWRLDCPRRDEPDIPILLVSSIKDCLTLACWDARIKRGDKIDVLCGYCDEKCRACCLNQGSTE